MAKSRLEQVIDLLKDEPQDAFLNHALAMEYIAAGNDALATEIMQKVLRLHPDHTGTYYHLGHALLRQGNREEAQQVWTDGIARCKALKKQHHLAELQSAYNELLYEDD